MGFLFTTVLVLLLVAPGLLIFRAYYSGRFSIRYSNLTITDQVFRSIVPGLVMQLLAFWIISICSSKSVRLDAIGILLLGAKEDKTVRSVFNLLRQQLGTILCYYLVMLIAGVLIGWLAQFIVRHFKLDRRIPWLRFDNQWHYLLTGEILETPDLQTAIGLLDASSINFIFVDVLMKLEKSNMLYSGILVDYELANDGGLRTIYLRQARRKILNTTKEENKSSNQLSSNKDESEVETIEEKINDYYDVNGDLMVIPYTQIINLNLSYYVDAGVNTNAEVDAESQFEIVVVPNDAEDSNLVLPVTSVEE